jgi:hypothetical protein
MKLTITLFAFFHSLISLQVYSANAGFFDGVWTDNDYKFVVVQVAVIFVSLFHLLKNKEERPTVISILLVFFLNILSVVICYEMSIEKQMKIGNAMALSFIASLMFPFLVKALLDYAPTGFKKIAESLPEMIINKLKKL